MKKRLRAPVPALCLTAVLLILSSFARAELRCPELDAALSMLEKGNPFLERYDEVTGADISARYEYGCPYLFAGSSVKDIGTVTRAWDSSIYYKEGEWYPAGLDCVGFTRWVFSESGRGLHPAISSLLGKSGEKYAVDTRGLGPDRLFEVLEPGDLLAVRHASGGYHILMYAGTLRMFGFTAEEAGKKLEDKLDLPLLIHCSANRDYSGRYLLWVRENARRANTTDGGVMVSIFGCLASDRDGELYNLDRSVLPYYDLSGYHLTVCSLGEGDASRWIRWRKE